MRKRYFARSEGAISDQPSSNAERAAPTASSTSSFPARADSNSFSSLDGEIYGNHSPERGSTSSPPMKSP
jgi:hypothetical protein